MLAQIICRLVFAETAATLCVAACFHLTPPLVYAYLRRRTGDDGQNVTQRYATITFTQKPTSNSAAMTTALMFASAVEYPQQQLPHLPLHQVYPVFFSLTQCHEENYDSLYL